MKYDEAYDPIFYKANKSETIVAMCNSLKNYNSPNMSL